MKTMKTMKTNMKTKTKMLKLASLAAAIAAVVLNTGATYAASIAVPVTGFDHDWILGSGETLGANDPGPAGFIYYSADSGVTTTTYPGLSSSGAQTIAGKGFQFAPYTGGGKNVLSQGTEYSSTFNSNMLTLVTPGSYTEISVVGSRLGNPGVSSMTINFFDGTNTGAISLEALPAWAGVTGGGDFDAGITNNGTSPGYDGSLGVVSYDLGSNGFSAKTVTSITFNNIALTDYVIFGVSGIAAIPEPSAALLGGIGALLLLRRRR